MTSRPFPAKYESVCPACRRKIEIGMSALFPSKESKEIIHEACANSTDFHTADQLQNPGQVQLTPAVAEIGKMAEGGKETWVQIAVWIPVAKSPKLLQAIELIRAEP